jgi:hypothetical protein
VTRHIAGVIAVGALAAGTPAAAHHSIAGVYDRNQPVKLEGTISEFHLVNPHAYLIITVDAGGGRTDSWKLEMDNRYELVDVGVKPDTLKPGDRVIVSGSRARDGSRSLYLLRLDRPTDGFTYEQVGSSPRIGRSR